MKLDEVPHHMNLNDDENGNAPDDLYASRSSQPMQPLQQSKLKQWLMMLFCWEVSRITQETNNTYIYIA